MLTHLQIRNFAIVDQVELDFGAGMTAITGETGAGKSIMIDALGLLLGDRAESGVVRHGAERAEINATFDLQNLPLAQSWLCEHDLDTDGECQLRRIIAGGGRSRAYINGSPQPLQMLKELGECLVDIHGQHEHQSLIRREVQRQLLDDYGDYGDLLVLVAERYRTMSQLQQRLQQLEQSGTERDARLDLLRFQIGELRALALQAGESEILTQEHRRQANAERLLDGCQQALNCIYENEQQSAYSLLTRALKQLEPLSSVDPRFTAITEMLQNALIQIEEAGDELRAYQQDVELDPGRLEWLEQRLADIDKLARKHRCEADALPILLTRLEAEFDTLDNSEQHLEELRAALGTAQQAYADSAADLHRKRSTFAKQLALRISEAMQDLGMPNGRFEIALEKLAQPTRYGLDGIEFLVSANPGQPVKPLSKVASGGELSRISLAIQVIAARNARIPTLIFDEVDSGIGGGVAEVVGRRLQALGRDRQVLCVTHLPQVAAQAGYHLKINKHTDGRSTSTQITMLNEAERINEIARMLGGLAVTDNTLAHAREMIEHAQLRRSA